jgi:NAD(P)-dependent dehydrogenase (short-subunit alcohol dehydrogenase family)
MTEHTTYQKIAPVTGANKGIGRAAAEQLAARGITVLIGARDPLRGEEAAAALRAAGGDAHAATLDVTDAATARAAAEQVEERFGHLDVLINNAGITGSRQVAPSDTGTAHRQRQQRRRLADHRQRPGRPLGGAVGVGRGHAVQVRAELADRAVRQ